MCRKRSSLPLIAANSRGLTTILDESAQRDVEILQIGEQLRHSRPIPGETEPTDRHNGEQLVGTRPRLGQPISVPETRHHLERVHLHVRLLAQRRQLPQEYAEGPLESRGNAD